MFTTYKGQKNIEIKGEEKKRGCLKLGNALNPAYVYLLTVYEDLQDLSHI